MAPGIPLGTITLNENDMPLKVIPPNANSNDKGSENNIQLNLIGFVKNSTLLNLPSTQLIHSIRPDSGKHKKLFLTLMVVAK